MYLHQNYGLVKLKMSHNFKTNYIYANWHISCILTLLKFNANFLKHPVRPRKG